MADAYVGRFAPTPSGPLHFGSLVAAVASYLAVGAAQRAVGAAQRAVGAAQRDVGAAQRDVGAAQRDVGAAQRAAKVGTAQRAATGRWLLRIEDLDPPREKPGAVTDILTTLSRFGFEWDGEVEYQSDHHDRFQAALERLIRDGHAYPCACSRREIADSADAEGLEGPVYPGTCRDGLPDGKEGRAWRVRVDHTPVVFDDHVFGRIAQDLEALTGDFVVKRADGYWAYQLAVVVDDAAQGITEVVRGADLLDSTTRQIHLQRLLGLPTPAYLHLPVVTGPDGKKLSKSLGAVPLDAGHEATALYAALVFLGQAPPDELRREDLATIWAWARANWRPARIPRVRAAPAPA